jgi:prevent-host-death family protein
MDRDFNVTEARRELLDLVERLQGGNRVVITKRGQLQAVLVSGERYALLEDLAWVLQDPGRGAALHQAWDELQRDQLIRLSQQTVPSGHSLQSLVRQSSRRRMQA